MRTPYPRLKDDTALSEVKSHIDQSIPHKSIFLRLGIKFMDYMCMLRDAKIRQGHDFDHRLI